MKITIRDILHAHGVLASTGGLDLPVAQALKVSRITRFVRQEAESAQEVQGEIIVRHAEKDPDGKPRRIELPGGGADIALADQDGFKADMKALKSQEIEFTGERIKVADLGDKAISSDMLDALAPWIE